MLGIRTSLRRLWLGGPARRLHASNLQTFRDKGQSPRKILFLCYGNICRSPVAEKLFQRLMPAAEVISAGFDAEEERSSPPNVQRAAQALGVDLSSWSSRRVDQKSVDAAELIVLHDLRNFRDFRRDYPSAQPKILFLGLVLDPPQIEITDPYEKSDNETIEVMRQIEIATQALARQFS